MALPEVSRESILAAIQQFDERFVREPEWEKWSENKAQTYVIDVAGNIYPPKKIISLASGSPVSTFSGGEATNSVLRGLGFTVRRLREPTLSETLQLILERYKSARENVPFAGHHEVRELFDTARGLLASSPSVRANQFLHVVASYGKGNWATIPWISILDERETKTTQAGTYVVYLFREDGAGCYVKLAQGVTRVEKEQGAEAIATLQARALQLRGEVSSLSEQGFDLSGQSDLGTNHRQARLYEASTIAAKYYEAGVIPNDAELYDDLTKLIGAYAEIVAKHPPDQAPSLDSRPIALVGTWREVLAEASAIQEAVDQKGGWASPWSFPLKDGAASRLKLPFYLYANVGSGELAVRLRVDEFESRRGADGMTSPWPDLTETQFAEKTRSGPSASEVFRTWFKVGDVEVLTPSLSLDDFDVVVGLSTRQNVLSQSTFGYVYDGEVEPPSAKVIPSNSSTEYSMAWLGARTGLEPDLLNEIVDALRGRFPQILLAGPPGTSKTWVAQQLATHLTGGREDRVQVVQFHPSYSYESFIEGLRPAATEGGITFAVTPGVVVELVNRMKACGHFDDLTRPYVIVMDEANRANLPRVLGELMYLFEYRGKKVRLQHSTEFALPKNLYFIGTMNTADQSIRAIDVALRRRFDVFELRPSADILSRYFGGVDTVPEGFVEGFALLNGALETELDRHHTIGHALLMLPEPLWPNLRRAWDRRIFPLIEDFFFDRPDVARQFTVKRFWPALDRDG